MNEVMTPEVQEEVAPVPVLDFGNPKVKARLLELVKIEHDVFMRQRIYKRADGTYYARLAVGATKEDLEKAVCERGKALMLNRHQFIKAFLERPNRFPQTFMPIMSAGLVARSKTYREASEFNQVPDELVIGRGTNLRVKEYADHSELHCDFKPTPNFIEKVHTAQNLCASLLITRTEPNLWYSHQVGHVVGLYCEDTAIEERVEASLSNRLADWVREELLKVQNNV